MHVLIDNTNNSNDMENHNNTTDLQVTDIDAGIYYKTLCSSGLQFVNKQQNQIEQRRQHLMENKQKLVYNNYDSLIKLSTFSKDLVNDFQKIENSLNNLKNTIPDFKVKCEEFSNDSQKISVRWKDVSSMLAKYPQMIEFLEIPQLLNNCIRTNYYDDALKICNFVSKICIRYKVVAPIFENMLVEINKSKDIMISQILKGLNGNIQLPVCIKSIHYLRQTDRFSEEQLRVNFLMARDIWFQTSINKNANVINSFTYISSITEVFRINIFDIVTQYRAIFPDVETVELSTHKNGIRKSGGESNYKIINSWLLFKIEHYLAILKNNLGSCVKNNSDLPIETVIDHCFYFGLSMSKIGADIRPQLIKIFNNFICERFQYRIEEANQRFKKSMNNVFKNIRKYNNTEKIEYNVQNFSIAFSYQNDIYGTFNEIRNNVPLCLIFTFASTLNASFLFISKCLNEYIREHEYSLNKEEFQYYIQLCNVCQDSLLPNLDKNFRQLCPITTISHKFSITSSELNKMDISKKIELNINSPIEEIGSVIKQISSKSL
ncbi:hypothetical protein RDWZM_008690 [Blomia tropicalis]|uniref:Conserved oligomeric Golgi complex subunit 8 n=1 Tax=Blomia tropicalis TaxID=40697 RepID=A0A9Q0LZW1_BLOTA|nr:hypothetical protein RDWZM_008690 [Blomia tropicalis]